MKLNPSIFLSLSLLCFSSFAQNKIEISDQFTFDERSRINKMFKNISRIKGDNASFYFSQLFDRGSIFETRVDGQLLIDFIEERFKVIKPMPEADATERTGPNGQKYFSVAYQKPRAVKNKDGSQDYIRDEIYFNKKFISDDLSVLMLSLGTLLHEANHSGSGDPHRHMDCPASYTSILSPGKNMAGVAGACDENEDGAYGLEAIFWGNMLTRVSDLNSEAHQMSRNHFIKAMSQIVSEDAQRRILMDLGIDEKLEEIYVPENEMAKIKEAFFLRKSASDEKWQLALKLDQARKLREREEAIRHYKIHLEGGDRNTTIFVELKYGNEPWHKVSFKDSQIFTYKRVQAEPLYIRYDPYQKRYADSPTGILRIARVYPTPVRPGSRNVRYNRYMFGMDILPGETDLRYMGSFLFQVGTIDYIDGVRQEPENLTKGIRVQEQ